VDLAARHAAVAPRQSPYVMMHIGSVEDAGYISKADLSSDDRLSTMRRSHISFQVHSSQGSITNPQGSAICRDLVFVDLVFYTLSIGILQAIVTSLVLSDSPMQLKNR
jgi:hypothetical protein